MLIVTTPEVDGGIAGGQPADPQRPFRAKGVIGCALRVAALADENGGSAGDVDTHWCGWARCRCMAWGSWLPLDCCQESTRVCVLAGVPPDRPREALVASRTKGGLMEVLFDRVAGLDVGKET